MKLFILISFNLLIFLNIYDCYSTIILLDAGATEANPYMSWVMSYLGILPSLMITKLFFFFILFYIGYKAYINNLTPRERWLTISVLIILNCVYGYFMYTINFKCMSMIN